MSKNSVGGKIFFTLAAIILATTLLVNIDSDLAAVELTALSANNVLPITVDTSRSASSTQLHALPASVLIQELDDDGPLTSLPFISSVEKWKKSIHNSSHPEDLLFAALTSAEIVKQDGFFTKNENLDLHEWFLLEAYSSDSNNVLINDQIFEYCSKTPHASVCALPYMESLLLQDGNNVFTNIKATMAAHQQGDTVNALLAMEKASSSPQVDDYFLKCMRAIDHSYQRAGIERSMTTLAN